MSYDGSSGYVAAGRCIDSGNPRSHAHLLGGNWIDKSDVAPSAILSVVSFLFILAVAYRYRETRVHLLIVFGVALLFLGIATVVTEQAFFLLTLSLFLLGHILFARTFLNRASLVHWPSTLLYLGCAILLAAFIVGCVAFGDAPFPQAESYFPSLKYTQKRIASATLMLIVATMHALLLPFAKLVAPELPGMELGLLTLSAWFLWTFFYLAFSLFPLLALTILLAFRLPRWGFTFPPRDLLDPYSHAAPAASHAAAAIAHEEAELGAAAAWAQDERRREAEEGALLDEMREVVGENAERAGLVGHREDDGWSLRMH
ncbi:hypothetical protein JCM10450v2_000428 [Rhodotorula kratochvilovae]